MSSPLANPRTWDAVVGPYERILAPIFARFATEALRLADVPDGSEVLDVACGPGTLALQAARRHRVSALDFAPEMIARLQARAAEAGLTVDARVGDAQALPWPDANFDAAFSMFGIIFCPDTTAALRELRRVTRGPVVVSSWRPMDPRLGAMVETLLAKLGAPPPAPFPLSDEAEIRARFAAAGFREVAVHTPSEAADYATTDAMIGDIVESSAPMVATRAAMGPAWASVEAAMRARVHGEWGDGPQRLAFDAWIAVGR